MDDRKYPNGVSVAAPPPQSTSELLKATDSLRGENRELRAAVMREAEELSGENIELRRFLDSKWR